MGVSQAVEFYKGAEARLVLDLCLLTCRVDIMPSFLTIADQEGSGRIHYEQRGPLEYSQTAQPPLIILGGMTQTIASWGGQLRFLAAHRQVVVYEARGQGKTELSLADVRPQQHIHDFVELVERLAIPEPVDICGFSFGGRIALAIAASEPALVRRLVISGVGAERGVIGRIIMHAWRAALDTGNLQALAWMSLRDTLGPQYLQQHEHLLEAMVKAVMERNSYEAIRALMTQTMSDEPGSSWHPCHLARKIKCPTLLLGGELDPLAPADEVTSLASYFPVPERVRTHIFANVGHTIAIEAAEAWRLQVLEFLGESGDGQ